MCNRQTKLTGQIFSRFIHCSMPCSPDVNLKDLARLTEGYTGADIKLVCREAAVAALDVCYSFFPTLVTWSYQKFADKLLHFF